MGYRVSGYIVLDETNRPMAMDYWGELGCPNSRNPVAVFSSRYDAAIATGRQRLACGPIKDAWKIQGIRDVSSREER